MSIKQSPNTYCALTCSFADLYRAAANYSIERSLRLVRFRLQNNQGDHSTSPITLATLPNEIFQIILDYVKMADADEPSANQFLEDHDDYEYSLWPDSIDPRAFGKWLALELYKKPRQHEVGGDCGPGNGCV
jgi:hypothetical protein